MAHLVHHGRTRGRRDVAALGKGNEAAAGRVRGDDGGLPVAGVRNVVGLAGDKEVDALRREWGKEKSRAASVRRVWLSWRERRWSACQCTASGGFSALQRRQRRQGEARRGKVRQGEAEGKGATKREENKKQSRRHSACVRRMSGSDACAYVRAHIYVVLSKQRTRRKR